MAVNEKMVRHLKSHMDANNNNNTINTNSVLLCIICVYFSADLSGSDGCVCCGGFPAHCYGEVRFLPVGVCEEKLAVRNFRHRSLHQLHDHHVAQCGQFLLSGVHI